MSWIRLGDEFLDSPEIVGLSDAAIVAYLRLLSYAARHLTDGAIPPEVLASVPWQLRRSIAAAGLLAGADGEAALPRFLDHHPPREKVLREREKARERLERWRSGNAVTNAVGNAVSNASPVPSRIGSSLPSSPTPPRRGDPSTWTGFEAEEWRPFLDAWGERFRLPPSGRESQPKTQRALLWQIVRGYPNRAAEWCREAPAGASPFDVVGHVRSAWRRAIKEAA